jgi:hypothetical protein
MNLLQPSPKHSGGDLDAQSMFTANLRELAPLVDVAGALARAAAPLAQHDAASIQQHLGGLRDFLVIDQVKDM